VFCGVAFDRRGRIGRYALAPCIVAGDQAGRTSARRFVPVRAVHHKDVGGVRRSARLVGCRHCLSSGCDCVQLLSRSDLIARRCAPRIVLHHVYCGRVCPRIVANSIPDGLIGVRDARLNARWQGPLIDNRGFRRCRFIGAGRCVHQAEGSTCQRDFFQSQMSESEDVADRWARHGISSDCTKERKPMANGSPR
jgi:hypothetical protein